MPTIDEQIAQTLAYLTQPAPEPAASPFDIAAQATSALAAMGQPMGQPDPGAVIGQDLAAAASAPVPPIGNDRQQYAAQPSVIPAPPPPAEIPVAVDKFGAEHDTVSAPSVDLSNPGNAYDPNANEYTPPQAATLGQANAMLGDQTARVAGAYEDFQAKKTAAQESHGLAKVAALEESARRQAEVDARFEKANAHAKALADAETATWLQNLGNLAKQEPNPHRYWENTSGLGKALWLTGLVFSAAHVAITPGAKNAALDMLREEIRQDVALQDARLKREMSVEQLKGTTMTARHARNLTDAHDKRARELTRVQALERAWLARAEVPGDLDKQAAKAEAQLFFEQNLKLPLIQDVQRQKFAEKQAAVAQAHAAAQANQQREWQEGQNALDRQLRRDLAQIELESKKGGRVPGYDENGIPVLRQVQSGTGAGASTGLIIKGPDGKPVGGDGVLRVRDDKQLQDATEVTEKANRRYHAMQKLRTLLAKHGGAIDTAMALGVGVTDPELMATINQLGYEIAKEHDPRITNQDFSKGVGQAMGFDPNGNWLERGKFATNTKDILAKLDADLSEMPNHVSNSLNKYVDGSIMGQGSKAVWQPVDLKSPEPKVPTSAETEGRPKPYDATAVTGVADYDKKVKADAANPAGVTQVPDHDREAVRAIKDTAVGSGPAAIKAKAADTIAKLEARRVELSERHAKTGADVGDELNRIEATKTIVQTVADDAAKKAVKTLKKFQTHMDGLRKTAEAGGWKWKPTAETARSVAGKMGLQRSTEVEDYIQRTYK
jgi:hypothetical protein